ncbi:MAG: hypothetical protein E4G96_06125 [Chrysiogenales bacterium]|nr:MAG: hypothetical protein E4G96_06125 [Chrysiogenales bacterium]
MKTASLFFAVTIITGCIVSGCKTPVREPQGGDGFSVTWEFSRAADGPDIRTAAVLVIRGSRNHRYPIGVYDGKVKRILSASEISREMTGGTLSGFITVLEGSGHEVIVRYDERLRRLIVMERPWHDRLPPGPFRRVHTIPVPEMHREATGF